MKKKVKEKNPFEKLTLTEYKNIKKQLPDSVSFTPQDLGIDANETICIEYYKNNYGLILRSLEENKPNHPKKEAEAQEEKALIEALSAMQQARIEADHILQEKARAIMQNGDCALLDKAEKIYNYFKEQNLGCENATLLSQFTLLGGSMKLLFDGLPGVGKSRSATEQISRFEERLHTQRIRIISGHITPLQTYMMLLKYNDEKDVIVCDESFFVVNDKNIQNMFKDALFRGVVYWESGKLPEGTPNEFKWKGNIILNANQFGRGDPHTNAFLDRLMVFKIHLSNEQIVQKILSSRRFEFDEELENEIMDRIIAIRGGEVSNELTESDKDYFYQLIANEVQLMSKSFSNVSFRTVQKCEQLYHCFKMYFGGFNEFTQNWYKQIATEIIQQGNTYENFIITTLKQVKGKMKTSELRELIQEHYSCGRTQAYQRISDLKETGRIEGTQTIILKQNTMM